MFRLLRAYWLPIVIVLLILLRFVLLLITPPGFYVDEAATGAHVVAMLKHGTDAHGTAWPLFSASLGGGYTTPVYLYPLTAWAAIFGTSEVSLRAFSQFVTIAAILILGVTTRLWLGKKQALIALVAGLILPWNWLQGSLAWDPVLVPLCVAAAFLGFSLLFLESSKKARMAGYVLLPFSLLALAYVYPPCRVTAPLLFAVAYIFLLWQKRISLRNVSITCAVSALIAIPLAIFMFQPEALERSQQLSVFYHHGIVSGLVQLVINIGLLINPFLLFITGDPNIRHSTGLQGILGIAALLPLCALAIYAWRRRASVTMSTLHLHKRQLLVVIALIGWLSALIGSALTNESQPHSLRATAAWPFIIILVTLGWEVLRNTQKTWLLRTAIGVAIVATMFYVADLAFFYPARAASGFDVTVRQAIYSKQQVSYPDLALQYYRNK